MTRTFTRREAFRAFGITLDNVNWSLSGVSADGSMVVVSLWRDELKWPSGSLVYDKPNTQDWKDGPGKRRFFEHLQFAIDHCDGLVHIVVSVRDPYDPVRTIDCYPRPNVVMRVGHLDVSQCAFRLEQVLPAKKAAA